jgi:hypothetical protein
MATLGTWIAFGYMQKWRKGVVDRGACVSGQEISMAAPLRYVASMSTMLSLAALLGIALLPVTPFDSADRGVREISTQIVRSRPLLEIAASKTSSSRKTSTPSKSVEEGNEPAIVQPAPSQSTNDASKPPAEPTSSANPASIPAAVEPAKDVWADSEIISALQDCVRLLAPITADVEILKPIKTEQCGTPAPIRLRSLGTSTKVAIVPPATINCHMAAALHEWIEKSLQPTAREMLGTDHANSWCFILLLPKSEQRSGWAD